MKKALFFFLIIFLISPIITQYKKLPPLIYAKEVNRVAAAYRGAGWIISPYEEAKGDHKVTNAHECDIRAVAAVNDARRLRIDIYLHNPITYKWKICYAFKITYKYGSYDAFIYFPTRNEFYFGKWDRNGRLLDSYLLKRDSHSDTCFVTASVVRGRRKPNTVVALIIDKDKHFAKSGRGKKRWITTRCFTGYIKAGAGENWIKGLREADITMDVRLGYIR